MHAHTWTSKHSMWPLPASYLWYRLLCWQAHGQRVRGFDIGVPNLRCEQ
jgi:hypothetical protein